MGVGVSIPELHINTPGLRLSLNPNATVYTKLTIRSSDTARLRAADQRSRVCVDVHVKVIEGSVHGCYMAVKSVNKLDNAVTPYSPTQQPPLATHGHGYHATLTYPTSVSPIAPSTEHPNPVVESQHVDFLSRHHSAPLPNGDVHLRLLARHTANFSPASYFISLVSGGQHGVVDITATLATLPYDNQTQASAIIRMGQTAYVHRDNHTVEQRPAILHDDEYIEALQWRIVDLERELGQSNIHPMHAHANVRLQKENARLTLLAEDLQHELNAVRGSSGPRAGSEYIVQLEAQIEQHKLTNRTLKVTLEECQQSLETKKSRVGLLETELTQARIKLREYDGRLDEYRNQSLKMQHREQENANQLEAQRRAIELQERNAQSQHHHHLTNTHARSDTLSDRRHDSEEGRDHGHDHGHHPSRARGHDHDQHSEQRYEVTVDRHHDCRSDRSASPVSQRGHHSHHSNQHEHHRPTTPQSKSQLEHHSYAHIERVSGREEEHRPASPRPPMHAHQHHDSHHRGMDDRAKLSEHAHSGHRALSPPSLHRSLSRPLNKHDHDRHHREEKEPVRHSPKHRDRSESPKRRTDSPKRHVDNHESPKAKVEPRPLLTRSATTTAVKAKEDDHHKPAIIRSVSTSVKIDSHAKTPAHVEVRKDATEHRVKKSDSHSSDRDSDDEEKKHRRAADKSHMPLHASHSPSRNSHHKHDKHEHEHEHEHFEVHHSHKAHSPKEHGHGEHLHREHDHSDHSHREHSHKEKEKERENDNHGDKHSDKHRDHHHHPHRNHAHDHHHDKDKRSPRPESHLTAQPASAHDEKDKRHAEAKHSPRHLSDKDKEKEREREREREKEHRHSPSPSHSSHHHHHGSESDKHPKREDEKDYHKEMDKDHHGSKPHPLDRSASARKLAPLTRTSSSVHKPVSKDDEDHGKLRHTTGAGKREEEAKEEDRSGSHRHGAKMSAIIEV